jgi:hypothetical protein
MPIDGIARVSRLDKAAHLVANVAHHRHGHADPDTYDSVSVTAQEDFAEQSTHAGHAQPPSRSLQNKQLFIQISELTRLYYDYIANNVKPPDWLSNNKTDWLPENCRLPGCGIYSHLSTGVVIPIDMGA